MVDRRTTIRGLFTITRLRWRSLKKENNTMIKIRIGEYDITEISGFLNWGRKISREKCKTDIGS